MPKKPLDIPLITLGPNVEILLLKVFFLIKKLKQIIFFMSSLRYFGLFWTTG